MSDSSGSSKPSDSKKRQPPVSLYPLTFTEAVRGLGSVKMGRKKRTPRGKKK